MPRLPIDYSKSIIYKLCCNDTIITECYVGHTTNFTNRKRQHKTSCNNKNIKDYNFYVYQFIREKGGWDNWSMIQIEEFCCENRLQAETRERYWIETLQSKLNKIIPTRTKQEYYEEHKTQLTENKKQRYEEHKEEIIEKSKQYRQEHKAEIKQKSKQKYTCECGSILRIRDKSRHEKSQKHLNFLELKNTCGSVNRER